jgi:phenylacetic acid degradation protein PaaD
MADPDLQKYLSALPILLGIEVLEASPERTVAAMTITEHHTNTSGTAHGGVIFTLADSTFGVAENLDATRPFIAMDVHVRYLRPVFPGQRIRAVAERVHKGRLTNCYDIRVYDERDRIIAILIGTGHAAGEKKAK